MKCRSLLFTAALLFGLFSCQKDRSAEITASTRDEAKDIQMLQDRADALDREIQTILAAPLDSRSGSIVVIPAGSSNALAAAVASVPEGGTIILAGGDHTESGMVTVDKPLKIIGQRGARLITPSEIFPQAIPLQGALYITGAPGTTISGIEFLPAGVRGGAAIVLHDSPGSSIFRNTISEYQFGVLVEGSDDVFLANNDISINLVWTTGAVADAYGITIINGERAIIFGNDIQNGLAGIWPCDKDGLAVANRVHGNYIGIILCKVPESSLSMPDGSFVGAQFSANNWILTNNQAKDNYDAGYLVVDGANHNFLGITNTASNNGTYDIELTSETDRFGFWVPASFENTVFARPNMTVKDCGDDNVVVGGIHVDINADPCY